VRQLESRVHNEPKFDPDSEYQGSG